MPQQPIKIQTPIVLEFKLKEMEKKLKAANQQLTATKKLINTVLKSFK
jgi:hypothetical protein